MTPAKPKMLRVSAALLSTCILFLASTSSLAYEPPPEPEPQVVDTEGWGDEFPPTLAPADESERSDVNAQEAAAIHRQFAQGIEDWFDNALQGFQRLLMGVASDDQ